MNGTWQSSPVFLERGCQAIAAADIKCIARNSGTTLINYPGIDSQEL
jgi:hypothetical protein